MGHDVRLLSGDRRPGSRALATREVVEDGIAITSINTEPFLAIDDPRNYNNPGVDRVVQAWIDDWRPDVVHAHSLQGLGAGWIDGVAASRQVVVTMHDWWWICARQFLVREDLSVCGPLVDTDGCHCAGGVAYNQARRAWLADRLARVSRVLAVSNYLRDSLLVNGYAAERVEVSVNGVDPAPMAEVTPVAPAREGPPRLGFVGGWHDFKGLPLLMAARRRLPDDPLPFTLSCWGAGASPETASLPPGVEVLPAYPAESTAAIMRSVDALAVPSLMRESFSLVTREALRCGTPVICSDSGGPEEAVQHGDNGLVVESGNPAAWTRILAAWASDANLRGRLRAGAARELADLAPVSVQAAGLVQTYEQVLAGPVGSLRTVVVRNGPRTPAAGIHETTAAPPDLLVVAGMDGAPLRYRGHHLAQAHRALGGRATVLDHRDPAIPGAISHRGIVVLYRVPWSNWTAGVVAAARQAGATLAFSVDDLIFDPDLRDRIPALTQLAAVDAEHWLADVSRYRATALACGVFLGSTPALVTAGHRLGMRAFLHDNYLGQESAHLAETALWLTREEREAARRSGTVDIAYMSGTTTHDADWAMVEPTVSDLLEDSIQARLTLIGPITVGKALAHHPRVRRIPFLPFQDLSALHTGVDIVLAPLEPDLDFSEAKSAVKWLEAACAGVPVVASPTLPFRQVIEDGVTGVLAEPGGWVDALRGLVKDRALREQIGRSARKSAYLTRGPWVEAAAWSELWPRLVEASSQVTVTAAPTSGDELRATPSALEPEAPAGYLVAIPPEPEATAHRLGGSHMIQAPLPARYSNLARIDLRTTTFARPSPSPLEVEIVDGSGATVRRAAIDARAITDDGWTAWQFEPIRSPGQGLDLRVTQPQARVGRGISCWVSLDPQDGGGRAGDQLCLRAWAQPARDEIIARALGQSLPAAHPGGSKRRRLRVLWHKGRHSISAIGLVPTAVRVVRFAGRYARGLSRRVRPGG